MKFAIMVSAMLVGQSAAYANQQESFPVTVVSQCTSDCAVAISKAEKETLKIAAQTCMPLEARRVSEWDSKTIGYGRVHVSAEFSCVE